MDKKWLSTYEKYLYRNDLVPLMIEEFHMGSHPAGQKLIRERAVFCRTFGPEDREKLDAFSESIMHFLAEASKTNADLAQKYQEKFEALYSKFSFRI